MEKIKYTRFKVRVFAHCTYVRFGCRLCDDLIERAGVAAVLEGYTEDLSKKADFGDICRECLDAGRDGAADRIRKYAGSLREKADWLEGLAGGVVHAETWATSADLDRLRRELDEELRKEDEELRKEYDRDATPTSN